MKKTLITASLILLLGGVISSCTANKKKKCDTCPKWTSSVEFFEETNLG